MNRHIKLQKNEEGMAAILITVIVVTILSVVTLGMAQLARREQTQSQDRQLSAEAQYAAESGIVDVIDTLKKNPSTTLTTDCSNPSVWSAGSTNTLDLPLAISGQLGNYAATSQYTCILVDDSPRSLEYAQVPQDNGVTANITTPGSISELVVGWEDYLGGTSFRSGSCTDFSVSGLWNSAPALKLDVTDLGNIPNYSRSNLVNYTNSFYLYPCAGSNPFTAFGVGVFTPTSPATNNTILSGNCDSRAQSHVRTQDLPLRCNAHVSFATATTKLLIRIKPIYGTAKIAVIGLNDCSPGPCSPQKMKGGQTIIDATGKSADVVKRIQVRHSESAPYLYALESANGICKRFSVSPSGTTLDAVGVAAGVDTNICNPALP